MGWTFAPSAALRGLACGIDGAALGVACALLTIDYSRQGQDAVASGFLVFAVGESLILSGAAMDLANSVPSFGAALRPRLRRVAVALVPDARHASA